MGSTTRQQTMQRMFFDQQREFDKARIKLEECELADCFNHRDIESLREENAKLTTRLTKADNLLKWILEQDGMDRSNRVRGRILFNIQKEVSLYVQGKEFWKI